MAEAIPLEMAEALTIAGYTLSSVSGGIVVVSGVLLVGGIYLIVKKGEKVKDLRVKAEKAKRSSICCCYALGPSGNYKLHFIMLPSRKKAEQAARFYPGANGVEYHPSNTKDKFPHFHPTRNGKKIPGVHFQFPK